MLVVHSVGISIILHPSSRAGLRAGKVPVAVVLLLSLTRITASTDVPQTLLNMPELKNIIGQIPRSIGETETHNCLEVALDVKKKCIRAIRLSCLQK
jgi:hypothetical protein